VAESENDRQYNTINMMTTMHAVLRDRYQRRAFLLSVSMLGAAIALNAFVFVSDEILTALFLGNAERAKLGIGVVSVVLLVAAVVELRVDWASKGKSHDEAVHRLGRLKSQYRAVYSRREEGIELRTEESNLSEEYGRVFAELPSIPDRQFAPLKAYHRFKCELSRQLDLDPAVPYWMVWLRVRISGALRGFSSDRRG